MKKICYYITSLLVAIFGVATVVNFPFQLISKIMQQSAYNEMNSTTQVGFFQIIANFVIACAAILVLIFSYIKKEKDSKPILLTVAAGLTVLSYYISLINNFSLINDCLDTIKNYKEYLSHALKETYESVIKLQNASILSLVGSSIVLLIDGALMILSSIGSWGVFKKLDNKI